jgi:hypothetical protein
MPLASSPTHASTATRHAPPDFARGGAGQLTTNQPPQTPERAQILT